MIRITAFFLLIALLSSAALLPGSPAFADQPSRKATADKPTPATTLARAPVDQLIPWLLDEDRQLRGIAFGEVIFDTTGKKVLTFDPRNEKGDKQGGRRRGAFHRRVRTRAARRWIEFSGLDGKGSTLEIHALGPCRSFSFQSEVES